MMHSEAITPRLHIPSAALVLEVGSGHRPHPRADVLTDKYLEDLERGGRLVADRPFVQAGAESLPFRKRAFDYVLCRHVLEHVEDPEAFFLELGRVGPAGYIETPSVIWEHLHPQRTHHRWLVLEVDGELVMMRKTQANMGSPFGSLFETMNKHSLEYRLLIRRYADLFFVRHHWNGKINYCLEPFDDERRAWFQQPWDEAKVARFVVSRNTRQQTRELLLGAVRGVWGALMRRRGMSLTSSRRHMIDLAKLMRCPACAELEVQIDDGQALCPACGWHTVVVLPG